MEKSKSPIVGGKKQQFDNPWKKIIESYFKDFLEFFFPQIAQHVNWACGFEFLDKEFQQAVHAAASGVQIADKLAKVWTRDGQETWVLIHIEVQHRQQNNFAQRMFVYNYRIYDYYKKHVVSLAILGDKNPDWKPDTFNSELWGCDINFRFPVIKLVDYETQWLQLESNNNPFAVVIMAHLLAQKTYNDKSSRAASKLSIIRHLFKRGRKRQDIIDLLIFIDWVLTLPEEMEQKVHQQVLNFKENKKMQYITSFERFAKKEGFKEGIEKGVEKGIEKERAHTRQLLLQMLKKNLVSKFGNKGASLLPILSKLTSAEELIACESKLTVAHSIEEFKKQIKLISNS